MPVTAKDVAFTLEVGRHPLSGVASSEAFRRIIKFDAKDDRRFTMTIDRVTFDYNRMGLSLLPAHIEKPIFEANPAEYRNKTAFDTNTTNPGLFFGPFRIVEVVPGNRIVLEQNPTWTGEKPLLQAHRRQDHREHRGARGQPAVGQRRLRAGRARPVARPGAGLREAPQGQVQLHLQAGADLRAHRHHARQQASGRPPRAPGDPDGDRPQGHLREAVRGQEPDRRRADKPARSDVQPQHQALPLRPRRRAQAPGRGGLLRHQERRAPQRQGRAPVARDHHHRRQPRARAGDAGDPEPAPPGRHRTAHQGRAAARLLRGR